MAKSPSKTALLMYSRAHFDPDRGWESASSAGIIAAGLYRSLRAAQFEVSYIDPSEIESVRGQSFFLFVGQNVYWTRAASACHFDYKVLFLPIVYPVQKMLQMKRASRITGKEVETIPRTDFRCFNDADAVFDIGNDAAIQELLSEGIPAEKVIHIHYGLPAPPESVFPAEKRVKNFLYLSSGINLFKGFPFLYEAWCRVRTPGARLKIVGKVYRDDYETDVRAFVNNPENQAEFCGYIPSETSEYWSTLQESGWLLFPTLGEEQPGTVIDAMAAGIVPIIDPYKSGIGFHVFNDYSMSLDQQYSEISKSYASDPVAWQALSERAKAHARIFYEAKSWEIRLQYIFESLRDYKALPRPRIFLERGQTFVAFSDSRNSILGPPPPDPLVISPEVIQGASLGDYWVYGARGPLRNWTEIGRAINFLEEHPKISSLVFNCSTIKSDLSLAHEEKAFRLPRGSIAVIRLSHLLGVTSENPDSVLSETPRFREGSLHFAWTDVEKGKDLAVSLADVVTLGPQHYKSHPASHLSPRRLWNRLQYETCSFVKNF